MSEKPVLHLYEITPEGLVNELSLFSCGVAPSGGHLVCAESKTGAIQKYHQHLRGLLPKQTLYGFKFPGSWDYLPYPIDNVIY